jgi:hypothetical protein
MKKLIYNITIFTISLLFLSCQSDSVNPLESSISDLTLNKNNPIIAKATGSGHYTFLVNDWRTFSFNARLYADGSVKGNYTRTHHLNGESTHAKGIVTCLIVDGNEAWIGGEDTQGSIYAPGFNGTVFHAVDNGEGANATSDQISPQFVEITPAQALEFCEDKFVPALNNVESGNIQVH